jgi:hypothetical protein
VNGHLTRDEALAVKSTPRHPGVVKKLAKKYNVSEDLIKHVRSAVCLCPCHRENRDARA